MQLQQVEFGQRIRVNLPGAGDHGHVGTIKRVLGDLCYVHLDRDQSPRHTVWFYAADLEHIPGEADPAGEIDRMEASGTGLAAQAPK